MIRGEVSACTAIDDYPMMGDVGRVGFFLEIGCDNECDIFDLSEEGVISFIRFGNCSH